MAPIALFAYKRPEHLRRTLASLLANPQARQSDLFVFCDGPRTQADAAGVKEVRDIVASLNGFASITRVVHEENQGLAASVIAGVSKVLAQSNDVIVVEDDLVLSPYFLQYMNDALRCYAHDPQVASIHGYVYPVDTALPETFFLRGGDCWGWATWRRAWQHFNPDGAALLRQLRDSGLQRVFDLDGSHGFTALLEAQIAGRADSWAVRWHASCFLQNMLTLYPGRTLVQNIGNDASGTHREATDAFTSPMQERPVRVERIALQESAEGREAFVRFFRHRHGSFLQRLKDRLSAARRS